MRTFLTAALVCAMGANVATAQNYVSKVWVGDLGNGKYQNPIVYADYSDPDLCRVGDDYYMTASSFNCVPGLPILHSKDLVNWELIGYALDRVVPASAYEGAQTYPATTVSDGRIFGENRFDRPQHGDGVWAPAIRYHEGEFYIYWGDPDEGIFMVKTKDPAGPWEAPVLVHKSKGIIDTCPLWDEDGRAWIGHGYAGSRAGLKSILGLIEMTPDGTRTIGEDRMIYDGHVDNVTIEGVKFYKRDGYYYILSPAGGVSTGWQVAMRSKDIYGPYEWKKVMAQGKTDINGPHQGGLIDTPDGSEEWFIHFQDVNTYGRVLLLEPVKWTDGWPVMGTDKDGDLCGDPVKTYKKPNLPTQEICTPVESDDFNHTGIGLQWQWHSNSNALWSFADANQGVLRLFSWAWPVDGEAAKNLWSVGNLLMQKFPAPNFKATAKVRFHPSDKHTGERCGLVVMGLDYAALAMENMGDEIRLSQVECLKAKKGTAETQNGDYVKVEQDQWIWLRVNVKHIDEDFASCSFEYSTDGEKFKSLGKDFKAQPGQWIGAKVGMFCTRTKLVTNDGGWMDADDFVIEK